MAMPKGGHGLDALHCSQWQHYPMFALFQGHPQSRTEAQSDGTREDSCVKRRHWLDADGLCIQASGNFCSLPDAWSSEASTSMWLRFTFSAEKTGLGSVFHQPQNLLLQYHYRHWLTNTVVVSVWNLKYRCRFRFIFLLRFKLGDSKWKMRL